MGFTWGVSVCLGARSVRLLGGTPPEVGEGGGFLWHSSGKPEKGKPGGTGLPGFEESCSSVSLQIICAPVSALLQRVSASVSASASVIDMFVLFGCTLIIREIC